MNATRARKKTRANRTLHALTVVTHPEAEDAVAELLNRNTGEAAITVRNRETGQSSVTVYLPDGNFLTTARRAELRQGLAAIRDFGLEIAPARIRWATVPAADWTESWKRHFPPLLIGRRLLVRPSWSRRRPRSGQEEIVLDPGLSFGTGQHPTTAFCLEEVVRASVEGSVSEGMLDVGTGSGVLALAAARLGYTPVSAFDFDPEAVEVARENAARNGLEELIQFARRDVATLSARPRRRWGLVCANLTADLLLRHAEALWNQVAPGGRLVLAGILKEEFTDVQERFAELGARLIRSAAGKEWRSGAFAAQTRERQRARAKD